MNRIDLGTGIIGVCADARELPENGIDAALIAKPFAREVRLDEEVSGLTTYAERMAQVSLSRDYPVLCGCRTRYKSVRHLSVLTFCRGRLVDVSDRTVDLDGSGYAVSNSLKVFRLPALRLGLLVDTDVLLANNWKRIAPQCDAIVCVALRPTDADFSYIPTLSSLFARPYAAAFSDGEILWGTPQKDKADA